MSRSEERRVFRVRVLAPISGIAAVITRATQTLISLKAIDRLMSLERERPPERVYVEIGRASCLPSSGAGGDIRNCRGYHAGDANPHFAEGHRSADVARTRAAAGAGLCRDRKSVVSSEFGCWRRYPELPRLSRGRRKPSFR